MVNLLYALAYVALPVATYVLSRNLTWTVSVITGSVGLVGALISFSINLGGRWDFASLQVATLLALTAAAAMTWLGRRHEALRVFPWRRHLIAVFLPVILVIAVLALSRIAAGPRAGFFTAVGFLVRRQYAEDNAKWLDFTSQLAAREDIVQAVALGGPLQLFLVIVASALAAASLLLLGGVNEVFVAANTVVYAQYFLAAMVPFVFAPLVEASIRDRKSGVKRSIPAPLLWTGMLVLVVAIIAISGLGHLTLEFVLLATVLWIGVFFIGSPTPNVYAMTSLTMVTISLVWFPLLPISVFVMIAGLGAIAVAFFKRGFNQPRLILVAVAWISVIIFTLPDYWSTFGYATESTAAQASVLNGAGGGVSASATASFLKVPAFDLLSSQGGTEVVGPVLGVLVLLTSVLATMFVSRQRQGQSTIRLVIAFAPAVLVGGYALLLAIVGTWWAGTGPNYGGLKTTFFAAVALASVGVPLALMEIDRKSHAMTVVRWSGVAGIVFLLTVDGILARAAVYVSPQQWPDATGENKGFWWPAEVLTQPEQSIESLPIACAYRPSPGDVPTVLPNGQSAYACSRILAGLSGADTTAQPIVDWQRREWLTNTPAWYNEYPGLLEVPEALRRKNFILLDEINTVIGLESVQSFMDRFKPDWAGETASGG